MKNNAKRQQLKELQKRVESIVYVEKKHATTQCELRKVGRKSIRKVAQAVQDSDSDSDPEGVSPFDMFKNTPSFKQNKDVQMMITRSQRKSVRGRRARESVAPVDKNESTEIEGENGEGSSKRELRSMKKRRLN